MLDGLRREADAAFFLLTLSRRSQSPLMNVRPSAWSSGCGYVGPRPTTEHAVAERSESARARLPRRLPSTRSSCSESARTIWAVRQKRQRD